MRDDNLLQVKCVAESFKKYKFYREKVSKIINFPWEDTISD